MQKLNIAFIGLGRIADLHIAGYRKNKYARLYAICDVNRDLVSARKAQWQPVTAYTDYGSLLNDAQVDAVEILTPHSTHERISIDALKAGKHVALQKPMTVNLASADRILQAATASARIFRVTDNYAFYPPILLAKRIIENGDIGKPISIRIKFIGGGSGGWHVPPETWQWRLKENIDSGGMRGFNTFDHGHHLWTTAWILGGPVSCVVGWIDSIDGIIDAPAVMLWKHANGIYGSIEFVHCPSLSVPSKYYANDEWIEVSGTGGIIIIRRCTGEILSGPAVSIFTNKGWKHYYEKSDWSLGFIGATRNFIASLRGTEKQILTGQDAREILRFALAVQKSAKIHREVYTEELDRAYPWLYYIQQRRRDTVPRKRRTSFLERVGLSCDTSKYSPQAKQLTTEFINNFNPDAVKNWSCVVALHITADGHGDGCIYTITITNGTLQVREGILPEKSDLTLSVPAGVWAAILLKKKRIETAYLQGLLKIQGKAEEALKLRAAFKI